MSIAQATPLADSWGMHGGGIGAGWWIVMVTMMVLFMGAMMWMMMRGMGGGSSQESSAPWDRFATRESPLEMLERRFAQGEISIEEYQARRAALVNGAAEPSDEDEKQLTASGAGEGRR
jgi:putative membrane protein